jgi:aminocyclopropanecarboxylate oxidase
VKLVCSQQYKIDREQHFKDSSPVRALNKAIEAEAQAKGNNVEKVENLDWEDVFQVHEMKETNSWPSEPEHFKYVQYSYLLIYTAGN